MSALVAVVVHHGFGFRLAERNLRSRAPKFALTPTARGDEGETASRAEDFHSPLEEVREDVGYAVVAFESLLPVGFGRCQQFLPWRRSNSTLPGGSSTIASSASKINCVKIWAARARGGEGALFATSFRQ